MAEYNGEIQLSVLIDGEYKSIGNIDKYECNTRYKNENSPMSKHISDSSFSLEIDKNTKFDDFDKIFGIDNSKTPDIYNVKFSYCVPCKRHKKKRINKKWINKYGQKYIVAYKVSKGLKLNTYTDGSFEFVKDGGL